MHTAHKADKKKTLFIIISLGLLSTIGPFSIDMYLPGFRTIANDFHTSINEVGYSLSSYFIGVSVGQLLFGPILDRYGRIIPLYIGLFVYLIASILCALSWNVESLIVLRVFQAIGSCGGMVAARAIVRDVFPVDKIANIFSYIMLFIALSPLFAPTLGGFFIAHLGWRSVFVFLTAFSILAIVSVYFWLPLKNKPDKSQSIRPKAIFKSYMKVLSNREFTTYALSTSLSQSGMFAYISGAPFVFMNLYGLNEQHFGLVFAFIGIGMATAGQINIIVLKYIKSEKITLLSIYMQVFVGITLVVGTYFNWLGMYSTILLIWLYMISQGFIMPNGSALSLTPFTKNAGSASAMMGAMQLGFGALVAAIVSSLFTTSALPMAASMFVCASSALLVLLYGRKKMRKISPSII